MYRNNKSITHDDREFIRTMTFDWGLIITIPTVKKSVKFEVIKLHIFRDDNYMEVDEFTTSDKLEDFLYYCPDVVEKILDFRNKYFQNEPPVRKFRPNKHHYFLFKEVSNEN